MSLNDADLKQLVEIGRGFHHNSGSRFSNSPGGSRLGFDGNSTVQVGKANPGRSQWWRPRCGGTPSATFKD
jgi:hypothetical protein